MLGKRRPPADTVDTCQVYWALAWCSLPRGHDGPHRGATDGAPPPLEAVLSGPDAPAFISTAVYVAPHRVRRLRMTRSRTRD